MGDPNRDSEGRGGHRKAMVTVKLKHVTSVTGHRARRCQYSRLRNSKCPDRNTGHGLGTGRGSTPRGAQRRDSHGLAVAMAAAVRPRRRPGPCPRRDFLSLCSQGLPFCYFSSPQSRVFNYSRFCVWEMPSPCPSCSRLLPGIWVRRHLVAFLSRCFLDLQGPALSQLSGLIPKNSFSAAASGPWFRAPT